MSANRRPLNAPPDQRPRYEFVGSGTAWAVTLGDVPILSASSQARATGEVVARVVAAGNEALDDLADAQAELAALRKQLAEANATADALAAWAATVEGRA